MGGDGKWWQGGKGGKDGKKRGRKHAFKILCPDVLITMIMGPKGVSKDQLEEETACRIIFSNREEFFPGTYCRTLCIYADEPEIIVTVLEQIVDHVVTCAEQEFLQSHPQGEGDFLGKEEGTYLLRVAVSVRMSGAIIGPKGVNIQAIRDESNAKLAIDKNNHFGHQILKVSGTPENIKLALVRVNEHVQSEADSEDFSQWAAVRVFSDEGKGWEKGKDDTDKGGKGKGKGKVKGKSKGASSGKAALPDRAASEDAGGRQRSRSPRGGPDAEWQEGPQEDAEGSWGGSCASGAVAPDVDAGMLQALAATCEEFPEGTLDMEYTLTCELPTPKVSALIGKKGDHIREVRKMTGAKIHFDEDPEGQDADTQQTMTIQGPLLRVYKAHALMMKRYHDVEVEQAAPPAEEVPDVKTLQAQLEDLQRQLQVVQKLAEGSAGAGKGKTKGKGKKG